MVWIGFDVGGTFTDLIAVDLDSTRLLAIKTPSSPTDPAGAALRGIRELLALGDIPPQRVTRVVHGTTIATNALIELKGARVGFLCNHGFRDVVEIGRMLREQLFDIDFRKTPPLVPRHLRREVPERMAVDGTVIEPLDEDAARAAIDGLLADGVEAIAVGLLHAYAHPGHELRLRELIAERAPQLAVTLSHEVSGEYGEHERWTSAIVNAYLMPRMQSYLRELTQQMQAMGIRTPIEVMQSNGGIAPVTVAGSLPIRMLESGPAGGVAGIAHLGTRLGMRQLITLDMGGTSADVSVVVDGSPTIATERLVGGHPVRAVMADIHSIGAGGGSIAAVDASGTLHVGPRSAGAEPGPVALRQGGTWPTVTDADIVLGYLNVDRYCAARYVERPPDADAAAGAIHDLIAEPTATTVDQSALGIVRIAVRNMVSAIRTITTQRGLDPRDFVLVASGGAGPVHASMVARELRIPTVVVPAYPALLSAHGMLLADYRTDTAQSFPTLLDDVDGALLTARFEELEAAGLEAFAGGQPGDGFEAERVVEMCYEGQQHELALAAPAGVLSDSDLKGFAESLDRRFSAHYGFLPAHNVPKLVNLRVFLRKQTPAIERLRSLVVREEAKVAVPAVATRRMVFAEHPEGVAASAYDRVQLSPGEPVRGPAVIEEDYSTTVICPGQDAVVDELGNILIRTQVAA